MNVDGLDFGVTAKRNCQLLSRTRMEEGDLLGKSVLAEFTTHTRRLESTERNGVVQHVRRVDPSGTSLELMCGFDRPVDVLREDSSSKTVDGVVGLADDILIILEFEDDTDGTEDLFLDDLHVGTDVTEDGWGDEVTLVTESLTTVVDSGAVSLSRLDVAHDTLKDEGMSAYG